MMIGKNAGRAVARAWSSVGIALLVLVMLEGVLRIGLAFYQPRKERELGRLHMAQVYPGVHWAAGCFREHHAMVLQWQSYVYWRPAPYRGSCTTVDEQGIRHTWNSGPAPSSKHLKIFMLGGSALWGFVARDEFTIPSLVSKKLSESGAKNVWVTNFGAPGYVSTQEVLALTLELRRGRVPDIAVFYSGFNDVATAVENRAAGLPANEAHRVAEFNLRRHLNLKGFAESRALFQLIQRFTVGPFRSEDHSGLAEAVADAYLGNVRIVQALARAFGFTPVFFWQPSVFDRDRPSAWESRIFRKRKMQAIGTMAKDTHRVLQGRIRRGDAQGVHILARLFDGDETTVFVDWVHTTERANAKVAEFMVFVIREALVSRN